MKILIDEKYFYLFSYGLTRIIVCMYINYSIVNWDYTNYFKLRRKRREDDIEGCVERLFKANPELAAELLMEALIICSKGSANFL